MELTLAVVRPLEASDLALLAANRGTASFELQKLSQRHHGLARSLASGVPPGEAAIIHGYDPSRVSILQGDPAFSELVAFYADKVDKAFENTAERLAQLSGEALNQLSDRLEDPETEFTTRELMSIAELGLDRTGYGKQTNSNVNVNLNLGDRIDAARKRVLAQRQAAAEQAAIEGTAKDVTPPDA